MSDMIEIPIIVLDHWLEALNRETTGPDGENNEQIIFVRDQLEHILSRLSR
jgi:hypothetical protein